MSSSRRWTSASGTELPGRSSLLPTAALSPLRQSSRLSNTGNSHSNAGNSLSRKLWPSTKSNNKKSSPSSSTPALSSSTLAHHLSKDDPLGSGPAPPQSFTRQRSCTEFPRFADDNPNGKKISKSSGKGSNAFGRSMRFLPSNKPSGVTLTPGRVAPAGLRKMNGSVDSRADIPSSESEHSDASKASTPRTIPKSPSPLVARTSSMRLLGSSSTQWTLSPGRRSSSPLKTMEAVPEAKCKKSLISVGWGHLFNRRKAAADTATPSKYSSSPASRAASLINSGGWEAAHRMRMMQCRLMQWRFVNARADAIGKIKVARAKVSLTSTWARTSELQEKAARKRLQLDKERLNLKLNGILSSQVQGLESWSRLQSKHSSALSNTGNCIRAAVCRLPLTNGAKASLHSFTATLQQIMELASMIKTILRSFSPMAEAAAVLLSELVRVVSNEQALLQECFELLGLASALQMEQQSLRCHLSQSYSLNRVRYNHVFA